MLVRGGVAQATAQRFAMACGGLRAQPVAVTVSAGVVDDVEAGRIDGVHPQTRSGVGTHTVHTIGSVET